MAEKADIYVLAGVTAVGKTAAALAWAKRCGAEILSCDSLLFYRGMDIGTAKPTPEEQAKVPHHGIDLHSADQIYDVGAYLAYAERVVRESKERGNRLLVVGGSGFYLQAFYSPVVDEVQVSPELRAQVMALEEAEGVPGLLRQLRKLNPDGLDGLDEHNPRRVSRALERCLASGKNLHDLKTNFQEGVHPFSSHRKHTWVLDRDSDDLEARIRQRVSSMLQGGLLDEVRALRKIGLEDNPSAARAVGYRETLLYLDGELGRDEWEESIALSTMRLARKQRKWFRSRLPVDRTISLSVQETGVNLPAPWEI